MAQAQYRVSYLKWQTMSHQFSAYLIGLLSFEKIFVFKSWCYSICMYENYVYLSGLPYFISMHLFYLYFHT